MEKELYGEMAELENHHWWFLGRRKILLDVLRQYLRGKRVLDVGSGTGANAKALIERGLLVDGVEPSPQGIALLKARVPDLRLIEDFFPSSKIERGAYDAVVLSDVLEHFDDDGAALRGVYDVLIDGGIVLMTTPAFKFLWTEHDELAHHKRRYRKRELEACMKQAGFEPTFVSYYNFFLFFPIALVRLLHRIIGKSSGKSDFSSTPRFLNGILSVIFSSERYMLKMFSLPFGVSLIAIGKKVNPLPSTL